MYTTHWDHIYIWQPPFHGSPNPPSSISPSDACEMHVPWFASQDLWLRNCQRVWLQIPGCLVLEGHHQEPWNPENWHLSKLRQDHFSLRKCFPKKKEKNAQLRKLLRCVCWVYWLRIRISIRILSWIPGMDRSMQRAWRAVTDQKCWRIFKNVHATWVRFCCVGPG